MENAKETGSGGMVVPVIAAIMTAGALRIARDIMIPVAVSFFLAMLLAPPIRWLKARRVPLAVTSVVSLLIIIAILLLLVDLVRISVANLIDQMPAYTTNVSAILAPLWKQLSSWGVDEEYIAELRNELDPATVAAFLGSTVGTGITSFFALVTNLVIIFFVTLLLLMEGNRFKEKIISAFGTRTMILESLEQIGKDLQRYIALKTAVSFLTGAMVFLFLSLIGLDFALLWGALAFALNFIPNIGSIVATIPPILLAIVQFHDSPSYAAAVLGGLSAVQIGIGYFIDPRVMGKGLHLSTLVVFLSMLLFGWLWGVVGVLLAVPLAVSMKVVFMHQERLRPLAVMLEG